MEDNINREEQESSINKAAGNIPIEDLELSARSYNVLKNAKIRYVDQLYQYTEKDLMALDHMGEVSVNEILNKLERISEDTPAAKAAYYSSEQYYKIFRNDVLSRFGDIDDVLTFSDVKKMQPNDMDGTIIKRYLDRMVSEGDLEDHNGRYAIRCRSILEAVKDLDDMYEMAITDKLSGKTLEEIGSKADVSKQRIGQIITRGMNKLKNGDRYKEGDRWFREDRYRYLYETYDIPKKKWVSVLQLPEYIYNYLAMEYKRGSRPFEDIKKDRNIDKEIREKIITKNEDSHIIIDGKEIAKMNSALETYVLSVYFRDEGTFDEFVKKYRKILVENGLENEPKLMLADSMLRTSMNRIVYSRYALWKQNERLRYYDIDSIDFTDFFAELDLKQYHDIEISTQKLIDDHPDLMKGYDIRDKYELHNLLKKIYDPDVCGKIVFERMPCICFGQFDREQTVKDLLKKMSPVSKSDFVNEICKRYGHDPKSIEANWLKSISIYYNNNIYSIPDLEDGDLTPEEIQKLKSALTEPFYFLEDLPDIISEKAPDLKGRYISTYPLKVAGFKTYNGYILRSGFTARSYFKNLIIDKNMNMNDLTKIDERILKLNAFINTLYHLKQNYTVIEYAPHRYITEKGLKKHFVTKEDLKQYCEDVKEFAGDNEYFTLYSLRRNGFRSDIDYLDFDDYFFESVLGIDHDIHATIEKYRRKEAKDNCLFFIGDNAHSKEDFAKREIRRNGIATTQDVRDYLRIEYNISISNILLRNICKSTGIQCNTPYEEALHKDDEAGSVILKVLKENDISLDDIINYKKDHQVKHRNAKTNRKG